MRIAIVGAGISGLSCADRLLRRSHVVRLFDKGRGPGGRMSTRRVEVQGRTVSFDHGAQYFTVRDATFAQQVDEWEQEGAVARWLDAGRDAWVGVPGMNAPVKSMATRHEIAWATNITGLERHAGTWALVGAPGGRRLRRGDHCRSGRTGCVTAWTRAVVLRYGGRKHLLFAVLDRHGCIRQSPQDQPSRRATLGCNRLGRTGWIEAGPRRSGKLGRPSGARVVQRTFGMFGGRGGRAASGAAAGGTRGKLARAYPFVSPSLALQPAQSNREFERFMGFCREHRRVR